MSRETIVTEEYIRNQVPNRKTKLKMLVMMEILQHREKTDISKDSIHYPKIKMILISNSAKCTTGYCCHLSSIPQTYHEAMRFLNRGRPWKNR